MPNFINLVSIVVRDYDEAIEWYTKNLGFTLLEDDRRSETKRWVVIGTPGASYTNILLAKGVGDKQINAIGNQTGDRVGFFLNTDDFNRDYERMKKNGVEFLEEPRHEEYGTVVQFKDLYGNKWDFIHRY